MSVYFVRPRIADVVFDLYARPLHPQLFDSVLVRQYQREDYQLTIRITRNGHAITWCKGDLVLTEIAEIEQELSPQHRLLHYRMRGEHSATYPFKPSLTYQASFQVETLA